MAITDFQSRIDGDSTDTWHRAGRELAQFWRDLRARAPRHSLMILTGVAAAVTFIGAALSMAPTGLVSAAAVPTAAVAQCEKQAWPYLDDTCLRWENASHVRREVRMISLDRDAPTSVPLPQGGSKAAKAAPKAPSNSRAKERTTR